MAKVYIGIDPGLSGGVAAIDGSLHILHLVDTPVISVSGRHSYDVGEMANILRRLALLGDSIVVLEAAQSMPGQGVSSTFSTGYGFGLWCGIIGALALPYRTVRPSVWIRKILAGSPGEGKARSIGFALRMFPGAELIPPGCRKPRDGRADALGLAFWGCRG
jgi:crossover junction endodeoxyribonuclease RuvC